MTTRPQKRLFEFGPFTMDTQERALMRDGIAVPVTPKAFEILLVLVENHGHVMNKDELLDRIWPDAFVEVGNLNRNISTLRNLLGDDPHDPRFIKTLPKIGYRFEADVREITMGGQLLVANGDSGTFELRAEAATIPSFERFSGRRRLAILAAAICLGLFLLAWAFNRDAFQDESSKAASVQTDPAAFDLYKKGRILWQDRSGESLHQATLLLEQAVNADPNFALAYAALADAYAFDGANRVKVKETAAAALQLDPTLGAPYATLGFVEMFWEWDFAAADAHFKQAVTLSPNYATGHQWYALNLQATGQGNAALAEMKKALELEPDSLSINADMCQLLYFNRRLDEAEAQCTKTLEIDTNFLNANLYLYDIYSAKGMDDEAVARFFANEEKLVHYAAFPGQLNELRTAYSTGGIRGYWRRRIDMLKQLPGSDYSIAMYHARLGEKEQALDRLRKAYKGRDLNFMNFAAEPLFFLCCYSDPGYDELRKLLIGH